MFIPILLSAVICLQLGEASNWKTVVSKEGQFVVDFPSDPTGSATRNQNTTGGRMTIVKVTCETPTVVYIAERITTASRIVKGAEQNQLVFTRDYFAELFSGKVISEKKLRFEGKPGLDFTIRGQAERGAILTIRVREYLSGQVTYALLAVSAPNRELPDDIGRFFGSFNIGSTPRAKVVAKEIAGKEIPGWGAMIDEDGDCGGEVSGKTLMLTVPGKLHDLNADIGKFNAPRVLREVDGNFTIEVKVGGEFKPGAKSLNPKSVPYNGAGLFVWRDSDNYIRLERAAIMRGGKLGAFVLFEEREGGSTGANHNGSMTPGTAWLRMERRGGRIYGFTSKDGSHWTQLKPIDTIWPGHLKIGVVAINSSDAPFTVKFEDLELKGKTESK